MHGIHRTRPIQVSTETANTKQNVGQTMRVAFYLIFLLVTVVVLANFMHHYALSMYVFTGHHRYTNNETKSEEPQNKKKI